MRLFVYLNFFISIVLLLTSCSSYNKETAVPQKVFQYSYKGPGRIVTNPDFSKHLSNSNAGTYVRIKLPDNQLTSAKLGRRYFSASGYQCRKYTVQNNNEYSACNIAGRWQEASPIILKN